MTLKRILICVVGFIVLSCSNSEKQDTGTDHASGTYVREYAIEVIHPENGNKIGMRKIRDSIFVRNTEQGYQVSNHKWRMNDYDMEGWVNMAHADDRPMPTFFAFYDETSHRLNSKMQVFLMRYLSRTVNYFEIDQKTLSTGKLINTL